MNPRLEVFSQGEEIVTGQVVDTNAAWLSQEAVALGFSVIRHTAVGDKLDDLVLLLMDISSRADCCICTGGLGPTSDDLTAEAVATAFSLPLEFDEIAFVQIQQFFSKRNRTMPDCNRKQAMLPQGAIRLDNAIGTAPGFALQQGRCWFAFVPGVPSEMRHLFLQHIKPMLLMQYSLKPSRLITIKTVGIGESDLQECINRIAIPLSVQVGFRAEIGEVQTKLLFPNDYPQAGLEKITELMTTAIGDAVYAVDGLGQQTGDLISVINQLMIANKQTLAVVESVSHGLLAAKLVGVDWLQSAVYERSLVNLAQRLDAEYMPDDLSATVKSIALQVQKITGTSLVLIQLCADENHILSHDKTQTVSTGLLVNNDIKLASRTLTGDIKRKQQQAALMSLDLLRRHLQGKDSILS
ncbi:nicotinamide-nucleotide amidase [biofilm metagenome]